MIPQFLLSVDEIRTQAYGAVAPSRRSSGRRIKAILCAAAIAMAVTALVLVATQDSAVSFILLNCPSEGQLTLHVCFSREKQATPSNEFKDKPWTR